MEEKNAEAVLGSMQHAQWQGGIDQEGYEDLGAADLDQQNQCLGNLEELGFGDFYAELGNMNA